MMALHIKKAHFTGINALESMATIFWRINLTVQKHLSEQVNKWIINTVG